MWAITRYHGPLEEEVGPVVKDEQQNIDAEKIRNCDIPIVMFRLLDGDREVYASGITQDLDKYGDVPFEPLDEWGADYGCVSLQYIKNGQWVEL